MIFSFNFSVKYSLGFYLQVSWLHFQKQLGQSTTDADTYLRMFPWACSYSPWTALTETIYLKADNLVNLWPAAAAAKSLQSCPTLCDPIDGSPPGSPIPGILQARTLEWVGISFSNAWKWKVKGKSLSRVWPSATPWTAALQAPPSMGFSRQEYWSRLPLLSPVCMKTLNLKRYMHPSVHGSTNLQ